MFRNYLKIAFRNLGRNKFSSFINIGGLAVGIAVTMLIGFWIHDEISFNKNFENYHHIARVQQFVKFGAEKSTYDVLPIPLAEELRTKYPDFKYVSLSRNRTTVISSGDKKFAKQGSFVEPAFIKMIQPQIMAGNRDGLSDMQSIFLSASLAQTFFGTENAVGKIIKLNNKENVKVSAVYRDFPMNSAFKNTLFLAPWDLYMAFDEPAKSSKYEWDNNDWQIYVQLKEDADFKNVSAKIKDIRMKKENPPAYKPEFFLHPMSKWRLYSDFKDGVNTGGLILFVWLFGIIGGFVLLLACINFMNLSTARSEKRAREVGIRKTMGSMQRQLVIQFLSESVLVSFFAFILSIALVIISLPFFNELSGKQMTTPVSNPVFWAIGVGFALLTGLIAGSYPALYLSSFNPIKVLKGTLKAGRFAAIPRKALVIVQFTVSITLIIGTVVVFRQIQYAKDRPAGYDRSRLIEVSNNTTVLANHFQALRNDLLKSGAIEEISASSGSVTEQGGGTTNISWRGKEPGSRPLVMANVITHEFGKTVGWQLVTGRDFSRSFATDSVSIILNNASVKLMGFTNPVGEEVTYNRKSYKVIGVINDMIRESPFEPVKPTFYFLSRPGTNVFNIKLSQQSATSEAIAQIKSAFNKYDPETPFEYRFVDEQYGYKFADEERISKLSAFFTSLAILISCLGLFGLSSFIAEQRTKEIGVRKVLGASVFQIWQLLSREFMLLVLISSFIAIPAAYYFMSKWLQNYEYRAALSWWIFAAGAISAIVITLLTVSFQSIKGAIANPVKSLRTE